MRADRVRLIAIMQKTLAVQNKTNLLLAIIGYDLAIAANIQRNLAKPGNTSEDAIVRVTFAEYWLVVARGGCELHFSLTQKWNIPMQPRWIDFSLLSQKLGCDQQ